MANELLRMENIIKNFPGVCALKGVTLQLDEGMVLGLLGENGAGKSTLMNVLGGIYKPDGGDIFIHGKKARIESVLDAQNSGIAFIHQELALVPFLSIAENFYLGREPRDKMGFVHKSVMYKNAEKYLKMTGLQQNPATRVRRLSKGQQQMVEIAKAFSLNARIIVMDEPTSSLSEKEVAVLFQAIKSFKKNGIGVIYISHKLSEIFEVTDKVMVMRDGCYIGEKATPKTDKDELVHMMVGRKLTDYYVRTYNKPGAVVLSVRNVSCGNILSNCSFDLHSGEILGFYGLIGAGRTELMETIFGLREKDAGQIFVLGEEMKKISPLMSKQKGIVLVPEDRKTEGLILGNMVSFNITISVLEYFISHLNVNKKKENQIVEDGIAEMSIKVSGPKQRVLNLSGGNQQKVVLAKWLAAHPKILVLDEPTKGIDVGAKAEIYKLINNLVKENIGVIMISSELPEVLNMCDRIIVMNSGRICGEINKEDFDQDKILSYTFGVGNEQ
jgi:ABC-type sugar transport system ATPase subunit